MLDITVKITEGSRLVYGATIEIEKKEDVEKLGNDVREAVGKILIDYSNPKDELSPIT